jgi:hypothetical protein
LPSRARRAAPARPGLLQQHGAAGGGSEGRAIPGIERVARRDHHRQALPALAQRGDDLGPRTVRQLQVHHGGVELGEPAGDGQRLALAVGDRDDVARILEQLFHRGRRDRLVIHHQQAQTALRH